jgi:cell wall-associated NlpC family hydrolase
LRYLLTVAVLAFFMAGNGLPVLADPSATAPQTQQAAPTTVTSAESGTPAQSPDVVQWTAQLIQEEHSAPEHRVSAAHGLGRFAGRILARTSRIARNLTRSALRFLGTPYAFGGESRAGFDCSGFVQHVFAMLGMNIPRTADAQYYAGRRIKGSMRPGDLVFFQTYAPGPSHVGIYLGHDRFVHASSHGVMVSSLSDAYWANRYLGAKRLIVR